jgi:uncharacterized membrane protein
MKHIILIVLASFVFSYYFVNIAGIPSWIKKKLKYPWGKRLKPLDCVTCLSVWTAFVLFFTPVVIVKFIAVIFTAGFVGYKIK